MKNKWHSVVFVDLDHTILRGPFEFALSKVCNELADKSGLERETTHRLVIQENLDRQKKPGAPAIWAMDWDDIANTVANRLGVRLETNVLEIVTSHNQPPYSLLLDEADEVLKQLSSHPHHAHRAIVAATQGLKKYQIPALKALDLISLFDDILTPDVHGALKQDIAFYGSWGQLPCLKIVVGDNYKTDIVAPHQFGFKTVWKRKSQVGVIRDNGGSCKRSVDPSGIERPLIELPEDIAQEVIIWSNGGHCNGGDPKKNISPDATIYSLSELPKVIMRLEEEFRIQSECVLSPRNTKAQRSLNCKYSVSLIRFIKSCFARLNRQVHRKRWVDNPLRALFNLL